MNIISKSERQTFNLAFQLARNLRGGEIICLSGELGTGKTVFVKGLAAGLGIKETITSPTFLLLKSYPSPKFKPLSLLHIDLYRLSKTRDIKELGLSEYLGNPTKICAIEWAEKIKSSLKELKTPKIWIKIEYRDENSRTLRLFPSSGKLSIFWLTSKE